MKVRSSQVTVQHTFSKAGAPIDPATVVAVASVVVAHPLAALSACGVSPDQVRGYGKGAIIGIDGDREHSAATLHPRFGAPVRAAIGGGVDVIPGTKKVAGPDAPHPDEIVIALALSAGGRPNARVRKPS